MASKVETTDKEREKHIEKTLGEMKKKTRGNERTRMDTMSKDQVESFCAIQSTLDALLRNPIAQDKLVADKQPGTRVDFVEPQRKKRESTPLLRIDNSIGSGMTKTAMKGGASNSTMVPGDSSAHPSITPDAIRWASTWEVINTTLEVFATRNTDTSDRGGGKSRKTFKKAKDFKDNSDGCTDTWVEVMRLHIEQDNLNDERQACTAILRNLEGTTLKCVVVKKEEERDTTGKIFEVLLNRFGSGIKGHQVMMRFEKRRQRDDESIDRILDNFESLTRRGEPEESTDRGKFSIASNFIDGVKSDDLRAMLATYCTLSKDNAPTPEEMREKSREYMLMKPREKEEVISATEK